MKKIAKFTVRVVKQPIKLGNYEDWEFEDNASALHFFQHARKADDCAFVELWNERYNCHTVWGEKVEREQRVAFEKFYPEVTVKEEL